MNEKNKTLAAVAILIGIFLVVVIAVIMALTGKKVISPVPEESGIKIIFISPTPPGVASPSSTLVPTKTR